MSGLRYAAAMRLIRSLAVLAPLAVASLAIAQDAEKPPDPKFAPETSPLIGYLIMAVLFGIVVVVSLMPSKRSHTDL